MRLSFENGLPKTSRSARDTNRELVTTAPVFFAQHPNVVEIGSAIQIIGLGTDRLDELDVVGAFERGPDRKTLVNADGDRLLLLRPFDLSAPFASSVKETDVFLAQLSFQESNYSVFFFLSRLPDGLVGDGDAELGKALAGLPGFRVMVPKFRVPFSPTRLSFASYDDFASKLIDLELVVERHSGGYVLPAKIVLAVPGTRSANGESVVERVATFNGLVETRRAEEERRKRLEREEKEKKRQAAIARQAREKEAKRKAAAARAEKQRQARYVETAFNDYFLRDCNNITALSRSRDGMGAASAMFSRIRPRNGRCVIDNFGITMSIAVGQVDPRGCDLTRSSGTCRVVMSYNCRLNVKIGQQFDPICPILRIPFPVNVTYQGGQGVLRVTGLTSS